MSTRAKLKAERVSCLLLVVAAIVLLGIVGWMGYLLFGLFQEDTGQGERVAVPELVGLSEDQATRELNRVNLVIGEIYRDHTAELETGMVFRQEPEPGTMRRPGARVELYVSLGSGSFTVPELTGKKIEDVVGILAQANLKLGKTTRLYAPGLDAGRVVNQDPPPLTERASSFSVNVTWADSKDPPDVMMPLLTRKSKTWAEQALFNAGLRLSRVNYISDDSVASGMVIRQSVQPGQQVKLGSPVEIDVAVSSDLHSAQTHGISLSIPVPNGPTEQYVKVKMYDDLTGETGRVIVDEVSSPGSLIEKRQDMEGGFTVMIFINDMTTPYREERLK